MFKEEKELPDEIGELAFMNEGLGFHWDATIRAYVCERCETVKIFRVSMLKHVMDHLKKGEGNRKHGN